MGKKIKVGIAGARGIANILGIQSYPDAEVYALCDINEDVLKTNAEKYGIPHTYRVFENMLQSDVDAVLVSTPMQLHVHQVIEALEAGKNVMCEVTAGCSIDELYFLCDAVRRSKKVYMMAENYCYSPESQILRSIVLSGAMGRPYFGEGEYLHDMRHYGTYDRSNWRRYWQLGTRGAFYPTHSLGPVMKCFPGRTIRSVASFGTGNFNSAEFRADDTTLTMCELDDGALVKIRVDCVSTRPHNLTYYSLQGTKGCYEAARGLGDQPKIFLEGRTECDIHDPVWQPLTDYYDEFLPERYKTATAEQKATGHNGGDFFIVSDFLDAVKGLKKPYVDVYDAVQWTAVGLLSSLSVQNGGKVYDMPDFGQYAQQKFEK